MSTVAVLPQLAMNAFNMLVTILAYFTACGGGSRWHRLLP